MGVLDEEKRSDKKKKKSREAGGSWLDAAEKREAPVK
jgi:hypothetical protein